MQSFRAHWICSSMLAVALLHRLCLGPLNFAAIKGEFDFRLPPGQHVRAAFRAAGSPLGDQHPRLALFKSVVCYLYMWDMYPTCWFGITCQITSNPILFRTTKVLWLILISGNSKSNLQHFFSSLERKSQKFSSHKVKCIIELSYPVGCFFFFSFLFNRSRVSCLYTIQN